MASMGASTPAIRPHPRPRGLLASSVVVLALAVVGGTFLFVGDAHRPAAQRGVVAVAVAILIAAPALGALSAGRRCPRLLFGCGVALLPRVVLSFSPLFFPLLVPTVVYLSLSADRCPSGHAPRRHLAANAAIVVLGFASIAALFVSVDPATYRSAGGGEWSTSDVISVGEASLGLAASALLVVVAWVSAQPSPSTPARSRAATAAASDSSA